MHRVAQRIGDARSARYVKWNVDRHVRADGSIATYTIEEFNLDQVNEGKLLFPLYERTRDERYVKAARLLREQLRRQPRTKEGGFWHKQTYLNQMWLDGLYMAAPFYAEYARTFNEPAAFDDVTRQFLLMSRHARDPRTGLLFHGWDGARRRPRFHPAPASRSRGAPPHPPGRRRRDARGAGSRLRPLVRRPRPTEPCGQLPRSIGVEHVRRCVRQGCPQGLSHPGLPHRRQSRVRRHHPRHGR